MKNNKECIDIINIEQSKILNNLKDIKKKIYN